MNTKETPNGWSRMIARVLKKSFGQKSKIIANLSRLGPDRAPGDLGGDGFTPLNTVAGSGYVAHFLKCLRSPQEDAGKVIWTTLAWTQYLFGLPYPILKHLWTPIHSVEG